MSNILEMKGIEKAFFGVTVLDKVDFSVRQGEVHALLGENGAGKSTLMNILAGVYTRDGGEVVFDGKPLVNTTVQKSESAGIAFVHQEINVFNDLKVYENIFMRKEITKFGVLNKRAMIKQSRELFERLGVDIEPNDLVSTFDTAKKQLLEIAKALFVNAKLIILDEPTTALSNEQIEHLFSIVERLKKEEGVSFIFISHKMNEIFALADRYTVLATAMNSWPGIRQSYVAEEKAALGIKSAQSGYYPTIALTAGLSTGTMSGSGVWGDQMKANFGESAGISLTLPLYDNGQTRAAVARARIEALNSTYDREEKENTLTHTIESTYLDARSAQEQYKAAQENALATADAYELISEQFQLGIKNTFEMLSAQNDLLQARQEALQAKYMALLNRKLLEFYNNIPITLE